MLSNQDYLIIVQISRSNSNVFQNCSSNCQGNDVNVFKTGNTRHCIADNMPFNSVEFHKFAKEWDFTITTSSPN